MKIDRSLMSRVPQSKEARMMVEVLVELAHKLNLTVCAEGVETEETLEFLSGVACDSAQGFLISPPIVAKAVPDVIRRWDGLQKRRRAAS
jgi:EAL domain-containing protein (putative c-di-GMP-specific phosphodiesterase class I)